MINCTICNEVYKIFMRYVLAVHGTPLRGSPSRPICSWQCRQRAGLGLWRHKTTLLRQAFNHSQPRWWVQSAWELPMMFCFLGKLPVFCCTLKTILSIQRCKGLHFHDAPSERQRMVFNIAYIIWGQSKTGKEWVYRIIKPSPLKCLGACVCVCVCVCVWERGGGEGGREGMEGARSD
jgi:hypothetical protein